MEISYKKWLICWTVIVSVCLIMMIGMSVYVDPYFHYHKPYLSRFFYLLDNERSQNDGIIKHFDYDALITGTSMTENFKSSEMDDIFGCKSIKVPFSGASYKEIDDNIDKAIEYNPNLKVVVRGLDSGRVLDDKDTMRFDLGVYPVYLYDKNPLNDWNYVFNKDVLVRDFKALNEFAFRSSSEVTGITSFDNYARWQDRVTFGINTVYPEGINVDKSAKQQALSEEEVERVKLNVQQNIIDSVEKNPEVEFYYFFTPYCVGWWGDLISAGQFEKYFEAKKLIIELCLDYDNLHLFSFDGETYITTDLNNYYNSMHYAEWVNSIMLIWMNDDKDRLTQANYRKVLENEENFYLEFDYDTLNKQVDYEDDYYAAKVLEKVLGR